MASQVTIAFVSSTNVGITLSGVNVLVTPGTPVGLYTLTYQICEIANPGNCDTAIVTVCVTTKPSIGTITNPTCLTPTGSIELTGLPTGNWTINPGNIAGNTATTTISGLASGSYTFTVTNSLGCTSLASASATIDVIPTPLLLIANNNIGIPVDGLIGGTSYSNILDNDTLNGNPVMASLVNTTFVSSTNIGITLSGVDVVVAAGTPNGSYELVYQICEISNLCNCKTAMVTVTVLTPSPSIAIIKRGEFNDLNNDGSAQVGETITYSFEVKNTGNVTLSNITITDILPGIVLSGGPISLLAGEINTSSFTAVYTLTIQDLINEMVTNQATVSGSTSSGVLVSDVSDDENYLENNPTIVKVYGCKLSVYNAITPNESVGINDYFHINNIECYPNNNVEIYDRWGVLVYKTRQYDNNLNKFNGVSQGRATNRKSSGLPTGTYFYVIDYISKNGNSENETGYLYIN